MKAIRPSKISNASAEHIGRILHYDYSHNDLKPSAASRKARKNPVRNAGSVALNDITLNGPLQAADFLPPIAETNINKLAVDTTHGIVSSHFIKNSTPEMRAIQFDLANNPLNSTVSPNQTVYKRYDPKLGVHISNIAADSTSPQTAAYIRKLSDLEIDFSAAVDFTNTPSSAAGSKNKIRLVELGNTLSGKNSASPNSVEDNRIRIWIDDANGRILAQIGNKGKSNSRTSATFNESDSIVPYYNNGLRDASLVTTFSLQQSIMNGEYNGLLGITPEGSGKTYQLIVQNFDGGNDFATKPVNFKPSSDPFPIKQFTNPSLLPSEAGLVNKISIEDNRSFNEIASSHPQILSNNSLSSLTQYDPKDLGIDMDEVRSRIAMELYRRRKANPSSVPYGIDIDEFSKNINIFFVDGPNVSPGTSYGSAAEISFAKSQADPSKVDMSIKPPVVVINPTSRGYSGRSQSGFLDKEYIFYNIVHEAGHSIDDLHNYLFASGYVPRYDKYPFNELYYPLSVHDDAALNFYLNRFYLNNPKITKPFSKAKASGYNALYPDPSQPFNYTFSPNEMYANSFANSVFSNTSKSLMRSPAMRERLLGQLDDRSIERALHDYESKLNSLRSNSNEPEHSFAYFRDYGSDYYLPSYDIVYKNPYFKADMQKYITDNPSIPSPIVEMFARNQMSTDQFGDILRDRKRGLSDLDDIFLMFGHKKGGKLSGGRSVSMMRKGNKASKRNKSKDTAADLGSDEFGGGVNTNSLSSPETISPERYATVQNDDGTWSDAFLLDNAQGIGFSPMSFKNAHQAAKQAKEDFSDQAAQYTLYKGLKSLQENPYDDNGLPFGGLREVSYSKTDKSKKKTDKKDNKIKQAYYGTVYGIYDDINQGVNDKKHRLELLERMRSGDSDSLAELTTESMDKAGQTIFNIADTAASIINPAVYGLVSNAVKSGVNIYNASKNGDLTAGVLLKNLGSSALNLLPYGLGSSAKLALNTARAVGQGSKAYNLLSTTGKALHTSYDFLNGSKSVGKIIPLSLSSSKKVSNVLSSAKKVSNVLSSAKKVSNVLFPDSALSNVLNNSSPYISAANNLLSGKFSKFGYNVLDMPFLNSSSIDSDTLSLLQGSKPDASL